MVIKGRKEENRVALSLNDEAIVRAREDGSE
jgi:hypothetical protein